MTDKGKPRRTAAGREASLADVAVTVGAADVAVTVGAAGWSRVGIDPVAVCRRAALAACAAVTPGPVEIGILLAGDDDIRALNRQWRGVDAATNVLAFPIGDGGTEGQPELAGDVALALGVTGREARSRGLSLADHLSHLVVHGVLHLFGYDHLTEPEAARMEPLEIAILAGLGVGDPYAGEAAPAGAAG